MKNLIRCFHTQLEFCFQTKFHPRMKLYLFHPGMNFVCKQNFFILCLDFVSVTCKHTLIALLFGKYSTNMFPLDKMSPIGRSVYTRRNVSTKRNVSIRWNVFLNGMFPPTWMHTPCLRKIADFTTEFLINRVNYTKQEKFRVNQIFAIIYYLKIINIYYLQKDFLHQKW